MSASLPEFAIVVAADEQNGIGKAGKLPWRLPGEMAFFKKLTTDAHAGLCNAVFMGRKTFESIPSKFRPLADRFNVVITRDAAYRQEGVLVVPSIDDALRELAAFQTLEHVYCGGGGEIYRLALAHPRCSRVYLTRVHARFECDAFLPPLDASFVLTEQDGPHEENGLRYTFETYERR